MGKRLVLVQIALQIALVLSLAAPALAARALRQQSRLDDGWKFFLAVRQPQDDRRVIVVSWGVYPAWESWTWPGREGRHMAAEVYSRYPSVRLYLNTELIGEQPTTQAQGFRTSFSLSYQPGVLKAVSVQNGREMESCQLTTAGDPVGIRLTPDRTIINADGRDLSFVKVDVVDRDGRLQPNAVQEVYFDVDGPGTLAGPGERESESGGTLPGHARPDVPWGGARDDPSDPRGRRDQADGRQHRFVPSVHDPLIAPGKWSADRL